VFLVFGSVAGYSLFRKDRLLVQSKAVTAVAPLMHFSLATFACTILATTLHLLPVVFGAVSVCLCVGLSAQNLETTDEKLMQLCRNVHIVNYARSGWKLVTFDLDC